MHSDTVSAERPLVWVDLDHSLILQVALAEIQVTLTPVGGGGGGGVTVTVCLCQASPAHPALWMIIHLLQSKGYYFEMYLFWEYWSIEISSYGQLPYSFHTQPRDLGVSSG